MSDLPPEDTPALLAAWAKCAHTAEMKELGNTDRHALWLVFSFAFQSGVVDGIQQVESMIDVAMQEASAKAIEKMEAGNEQG